MSMPIVLSISGKRIEVDAEPIAIGSDPSVTITLPDDGRIKPRHAMIRRVAGRWLVEVREAETIQVGDAAPARLQWLNPGDVIHLAEGGPEIIFQPGAAGSQPQSATTDSSSLQSAPLAGATPVAVPVAAPVLKPVAVKPATPPSPAAIEPIELAALRPAQARSQVPRVRPPPPALQQQAPPAAREGTWFTPVAVIAAAVAAAGILIVAAWIGFGRGSASPPEPAARTGANDSSATKSHVATGVSGGERDVTKGTKPSQTSGDKSPSMATAAPAMPDSHRALYAVLVHDATGERQFRLGTAWALSSKRLVTSAAVVIAIEDLQESGLTAIVTPAGGIRGIPVTATRVHPAYRQARLDDDYPVQAGCDVGVLNVDERLVQVLVPVSGGPPAANAPCLLTGLPFGIDVYRASTPVAAGKVEGRAGRTTASQDGENGAWNLELDPGGEVSRQNWSGSPVLNQAGQVVGVYSRTRNNAGDDTHAGGDRATSHAVTPIGRLQDILPDMQ